MRFLVHHLVEETAVRTPDAVAVGDSGRELTYQELDRRSNQVARLLLDLGVSRGDRVGVYLDKSTEAVVAVYAIMKAGAAYVPFDPDAPIKRLAYIAHNCDLGVILTGREKENNLGTLAATGIPIKALVVLNGDSEMSLSHVPVLGSSHPDTYPATSPDVAVVDQDLAYILYTSGSTGEPKGVMLTHRNCLAFVEWAVEEFGVRSADRLSNLAPFHFDLSVFDLYAAAWAGARVVLVPPRTSLFPPQLREFIGSEEISIWYSVPSVLTMLVLRGGLRHGDLPSLRAVLFAGEVFPAKYLSELMRLLPHARFANLYGPTETNVCTWYEVLEPPEPTDDIPIGRAIPNDEVFAMTEDGSEASVGEGGELHVRGATVMRGYWGDSSRTAGSLIVDPRAVSLGDPVYKTGDLVEILANGDFRYVGRRDSQVKTRGFRVELGEIEFAINTHPDVTECAVLAVPDEVVTNRLIAFVSGRKLSVAALVAHCREQLPRYMVPDTIELLDTLPKISTGKVDRNGLSSRATLTTRNPYPR